MLGSGRRGYAELPAALTLADRALSLAPNAAGILNSRAMVYLRQRRFPLAIADYAASLEVQSDQASACSAAASRGCSSAGTTGSRILRRRGAGTDVDALFVQMGVLPSRS